MTVDPAVLIREGILAAGTVILFLLVGLVALVVRTASLPVYRKCGFKRCSANTLSPERSRQFCSGLLSISISV